MALSDMAALEVPDLETDRLILRGPAESDVENWATTIWADPEVMRYMPRNTAPPEETARGVMNFFNDVRNHARYGAWIIAGRADGRFMGHSILACREAFDEPELGYALAKPFWGQGYATEAARAIVRYGIDEAGIRRFFAVAFPENVPSWRILNKLGFRYEKDVEHYGLTLGYYARNSSDFTNN